MAFLKAIINKNKETIIETFRILIIRCGKSVYAYYSHDNHVVVRSKMMYNPDKR